MAAQLDHDDMLMIALRISLDTIDNKDEFIRRLNRVDWNYMDLEHVDALLLKHNVTFHDLEPLLDCICNNLSDVDIEPIEYHNLTKHNITVRKHGSLRALIFIVFRYEKQMHEVKIINDLYMNRIAINEHQWLTGIFERLNELLDEQFASICETSSLKDIVDYKNSHRITINRMHVLSAIKNPDTSVFKYVKNNFMGKAVGKAVLLGCNDRFNECVDLEYVIKHAPDDTCVLFAEFKYEDYRTRFNLAKFAFYSGKICFANLMLSDMILHFGEKYCDKIMEIIDADTPITIANWYNMCGLSTDACYRPKPFTVPNIMSACRHVDITRITNILIHVPKSVEMLQALYHDKYSSTCTVDEDVYNANKELLYKMILYLSNCNSKLDKHHADILLELNDGDTRVFDLIINSYSGTTLYNVVRKAIRLGFTQNELNINMLLKKLSVEQAFEIISDLGITADDFDMRILFHRYCGIESAASIMAFVSLIESLQLKKRMLLEKPAALNQEKPAALAGPPMLLRQIYGKCSFQFVAMLKSVLELEADVCEKLISR
jgi:hypothetical protein